MKELRHHGVKGMKWGVRRYQNKDGSLTPAGRERAKQIRNNEGKLEKTSDGYILRKGAKVQRVSYDVEETLRDYAFISFTKHDNKFYDKNFTENLEFADDTKDVYRNSFTVNNDLKIPSADTSKRLFLDLYKERTNELVEAMSKTRRFADMNFSPLTYQFRGSNEKYKGDYQRAFDDAVKYYHDRYNSMTIKQLENDAYYDFMASLSDHSNLRQAYFDKMKANGYNAILDDNDAKGLGSRGYEKGETPSFPLIVIDASSNLKYSKSDLLVKGNPEEDW